jgi:outer membrane protein insertion porin family
VDRAEQEIKRQYLSRSLYGAEVVTTVTPLERNRVNVTFTMTEGDTAKIKEVRITGASAFTESQLLSLLDLTPSGWMTWYTKSDRYSRSKLNSDLETLRAYYVNRGYLEFAIESTQVTISPDKQDISITIALREGQPYLVTAVRLEVAVLLRVAPTATEAEVGVAKIRVGVGSGVVKVLTLE